MNRRAATMAAACLVGIALARVVVDEITPAWLLRETRRGRVDVSFTVLGDDPGRFRTFALDVFENGDWRLPSLETLGAVRARVELNFVPIPSIPSARRAVVVLGDEFPYGLPVPPGFTRIERSGFLGYDSTGEIVTAIDALGVGPTYEVWYRSVPERFLRRAGGLDQRDPDGRFRGTGGVKAPRAARDLVRIVKGKASRPWVPVLRLRDELRRRVSVVPGTDDAEPLFDRFHDSEYILKGGRATAYDLLRLTALICRWGGAPCRIAVGYERHRTTHDYRWQDQVAWLEVYLSQIGWTMVPQTSVANPTVA